MLLIPIAKPTLSEQETRYVTDAMSSGWVSSSGEYIEKLEKGFADFCEVKHCILTANGTVAIHLALVALGIGPGDEVIVPDLTFAATANAVILAGAKPVIVDVCASDWCLDAKLVAEHVNSRTKAIIPVHLYGHPSNMDALMQLAEQHDLKVIEDAAEAHGARYQGRRVGGIGDCATFSFYGNKIMTTGEGGCVTTNSDEVAERARMLRDHGMSKAKRYWHDEVGFNYRMTNLQAALGVAQLEKIDKFIIDRARILETYKHYLLPHGLLLNPCREGCEPVNWMTCVLLPENGSTDRDAVLLELKRQGVDTRPFFYPMSQMPIYETRDNPVSQNLSSRGLNLPTFPGLRDEEIRNISEKVLQALKHFII